MQFSAFPKGHDRHLKGPLNHTPSRGRHGAWVWIKDRYYLRTNGGTRLQALPKGISEIMRARLEKRNRTVRLVRYTLILALVIGALVMLAGCGGEPVSGGSSLRAYPDSAHGVICYQAGSYTEHLSCVKVRP